MVRLGCVPEQGGPSAYMENAKAVRTAAPGRQEQTDDLGKNGPETTAVRSNDSACRDQAVWSWTEGADDWREQAVRMLEQLKKQYPGIVFWVDGTNRGKAKIMSLDRENLAWSTASSFPYF